MFRKGDSMTHEAEADVTYVSVFAINHKRLEALIMKAYYSYQL